MKKPGEEGPQPGAQMDLFAALPPKVDSDLMPLTPTSAEDPVAYKLIVDEPTLGEALEALSARGEVSDTCGDADFYGQHGAAPRPSDGTRDQRRPVGSWYVPLTGESGMRTPEQQRVIEGLKPWLEGKARKVAHSAKFVLHVMANEGIHLLAPGAGRLDDTRLEDYVLESHNRHELERLSLRWLHRDIPGTEEVFGKGASKKATHEVEPEKAARCGVEQAAAIRALHARFTMKLAEDPGQKLTSIYEEIELPTERVLFRMERTGTLIGYRAAPPSE